MARAEHNGPGRVVGTGGGLRRRWRYQSRVRGELIKLPSGLSRSVSPPVAAFLNAQVARAIRCSVSKTVQLVEKVAA
jgi:hypothetical protein